jgi:hypothetical protein
VAIGLVLLAAGLFVQGGTGVASRDGRDDGWDGSATGDAVWRGPLGDALDGRWSEITRHRWWARKPTAEQVDALIGKMVGLKAHDLLLVDEEGRTFYEADVNDLAADEPQIHAVTIQAVSTGLSGRQLQFLSREPVDRAAAQRWLLTELDYEEYHRSAGHYLISSAGEQRQRLRETDWQKFQREHPREAARMGRGGFNPDDFWQQMQRNAKRVPRP